MANSLLSIKPHEVSRDLRGYSVLFYGTPKSGKTTIASKFPGSLILAFEKGYNAIPGIMAKDINSWGDFKKTLSELKDPEVQKIFQTIVIDTADIAYGYCEKFICSRESTGNNSYENIAEIPFGKGYKLCGVEFDECIRRILQMGYGLVLISHSEDKTFKDETGAEFSQIVPTLDKRARLICERTCDIIGYSRAIDTENGTVTKLYMRGTPRYVAGSRFRYTPDSIDFTYENLVNAIAEAIEKEESNGGYVTDTRKAPNYLDEKEYDFPAMMEEFQTLVGNIMQNNPSLAPKITAIVETHLGKGKKVGDCTSEQAPQLDLILFDIRKLG